MSEYKEKIDKTVWSYSRITAFHSCPYAFYLQYLLDKDIRNEQYPPENNFYAELGGYVHEILEMIFKEELSIDDAPMYYMEHYKENVKTKVKKSIMDKKYEACADYFAEVDFGWLENFEILGVELKINTEIAGYPFIGYIDLLLRDKENGGIVLLDHKSAKYPRGKKGQILSSSKNGFESYKHQMYLYCKFVKETYGEFPKKIVWNHFADGGQFMSIPFKQEEYENALNWFEEQIRIIEKEEEFAPKIDFFACSQLCNFRKSCEYRPKYEPWKNKKKNKK